LSRVWIAQGDGDEEMRLIKGSAVRCAGVVVNSSGLICKALEMSCAAASAFEGTVKGGG
jgi:hypothetical protein